MEDFKSIYENELCEYSDYAINYAYTVGYDKIADAKKNGIQISNIVFEYESFEQMLFYTENDLCEAKLNYVLGLLDDVQEIKLNLYQDDNGDLSWDEIIRLFKLGTDEYDVFKNVFEEYNYIYEIAPDSSVVAILY